MIQKGKCPLCGKDNHCAIVHHKDPMTCWCMEKKIPEGLRKQVPESLRKQACICENCVDLYIKQGGK